MKSATTLDAEILRFVKSDHDGQETDDDREAERCGLVATLVTERVKKPLVWSVVYAMDAYTETDDLELWVVSDDGAVCTIRQEKGTGKYESRLIPVGDVHVRRKDGLDGAWAIVAQGKRAEFFEGDNAIPIVLDRIGEIDS